MSIPMNQPRGLRPSAEIATWIRSRLAKRSIGLLAVDLGLGEILIDKLANRIPMRPDILERADAVMARELTIEVSSNPKKERGERQ